MISKEYLRYCLSDTYDYMRFTLQRTELYISAILAYFFLGTFFLNLQSTNDMLQVILSGMENGLTIHPFLVIFKWQISKETRIE